MKPGIELHIEELVLHGFNYADRYRIAEAIENELVRLFAERNIPPALLAGGEVEQVDGGAFELQPGARPDIVGVQVAHAVYSQLRSGAHRSQRSPSPGNAARGISDHEGQVGLERGSRL